MLDWIFEGIVTWISSAATKLMDAVSGLFLNALGTDMTAMEEYFPFVTKAFSAMQYTAWAILFLIFVWQLFRVFGGPVTEAENPLILLARSAIFALLIGYAKSIFMIVLNIARAPYTALMDISMSAEDFTFAGIEEVLKNGMTTLLAEASGIGTLLIAILMISLGWNYFKLLLETVERYVVVGVLCYTSPLAYSLGGSMTTAKVFSSWCRMIGSQLLLLVMNVWFLRAFDSSVGYFIGTGGTLTTGQGSIFLWMFCALAFLKTAQRFDSYLASMGLNVAQTGSSMGMEMLMAARVIGGAANVGGRTVGSVFKGGSGAASATATGTGAAASGFASGFASQFKGNSYVRDAVVSGGSGNMGVGGAVGFVARTFGGIAARNGASLTAESVSSVAARSPSVSGTIAGDIADRSLSNYMPQFGGMQLKGTQITGGHISTKSVGADGKSANVELFNTAQYDKPEGPHSIVTAADGSTWYQVASGAGANEFYTAPTFTGSPDEAAQVAAQFPEAEEGTILRTVDEGQIEATMPDGSNSMWYSSAFFDEPDAPHTTMEAADGVEWYAMQPSGEAPAFETLQGFGVEAAFTGSGETASEVGGENTDIPQVSMPEQKTPLESVPFYEAAQQETIEPGVPLSEGTPPEVSAPDAQFYQGSAPDAVQPSVSSYEGMPPEVSAPDAQFYQGSAPDAVQPGVSSYEGMPPEVSTSDAQFSQGSTPDAVQPSVSSFEGTPPEAIQEESPFYGRATPGDGQTSSPSNEGTPPEVSQPEAPFYGGATPGGGQLSGPTYEGTPPEVSQPETPFYEGTALDAGKPSAPSYEGTRQETPTTGGGFYGASQLETGGSGQQSTPFYGGAAQPGADAGAEYATPEAVNAYNQAQFQTFMPGFEEPIVSVDGSAGRNGRFEVRHENGSGTRFYNATQYAAPKGDHKVYEDARGGKWYAIRGEPTVERRPVYENGKPVYEGDSVKTTTVETVRYKNVPARFDGPKHRKKSARTPKRKNP